LWTAMLTWQGHCTERRRCRLACGGSRPQPLRTGMPSGRGDEKAQLQRIFLLAWACCRSAHQGVEHFYIGENDVESERGVASDAEAEHVAIEALLWRRATQFLKHWRSWRLRSRKLAAATEELLASGPRSEALRAMRKMREAALSGLEAREQLRIARWHLRRARLGRAMSCLHRASKSRSCSRHKVGKAAAYHERLLCWQAWTRWRVDPAALERAARFRTLSVWREWVRGIQHSLMAEQRVEEAWKWKRSGPRSCWEGWRLFAQQQSVRRAGVAEAVIDFGRKYALLVLSSMLGLWHMRVILSRRARMFWCARWKLRLNVALAAWREFAARSRRRQQKADMVLTAVLSRRRVRMCRHWQLSFVASRSMHEVQEMESRSLKVRSLAALAWYKQKKSQQEVQRRRAVKWRYWKTRAKVFQALRLAIAKQLAAEACVLRVLEHKSKQLVTLYLCSWAFIVQPAWQIQARRHHDKAMLHKGLLALHWYMTWRLSKLHLHARAEAELETCHLRLAWRHMTKSIKAALERRRNLQTRELHGHHCCRVRAARRSLHIWRSDFVPMRQQLSQMRQRAMSHWRSCLLRAAWTALEQWMHFQQAQAIRVTPRLVCMKRQCVQRWLHSWQCAAFENRCSRAQREEALLQWYAVLCRSVLTIWRAWYEQRLKKKRRQARAMDLFVKAQQETAVRALLWRFDEQREEEEAAAARHLALEHQRRVECAKPFAKLWRAVARERASCELCGYSSCSMRSIEDECMLRSGCSDLAGDTSADSHWILGNIPTSLPMRFTTPSTDFPSDSSQTGLLEVSPEPLRRSWTPSLSDSWPTPLEAGSEVRALLLSGISEAACLGTASARTASV